MKDIIVSDIDIHFLKLIRKNVRSLIEQSAVEFDQEQNVVLDVAPQDHGGAKEFFTKAQIKTLDIDPESSADYIADLCVDNSRIIPAETADLIICTEVLEHTLQPFAAVKEIYRILKKGGSAVVSTPYNFRIHGPLPDCWRFTEHGLRELFKEFSKVTVTPLETEGRDLCPIHYTTIVVK